MNLLTPSEVKNYLRERGRATLTDLVNRFDSDPEAVRGVLAHWQRKGRVRCDQAPLCGGCGKCDAALREVWQWQEE